MARRLAREEAINAYYARGLERDRLASGSGALEYARTQALLQRFLPAPPVRSGVRGPRGGRSAGWAPPQSNRRPRLFHHGLPAPPRGAGRRVRRRGPGSRSHARDRRPRLAAARPGCAACRPGAPGDIAERAATAGGGALAARGERPSARDGPSTLTVYFALGGIFFANPGMRAELRKDPALSRTQESMHRVRPAGRGLRARLPVGVVIGLLHRP